MDALFPCRCRLDLDGVAVPTLLLDLALILFSGSDLVLSEILDPSVLALSLVLDLTLVVGLVLVPALTLELVLVLLVFGLRLALVLLWILALAFLVTVPISISAPVWPSWCRSCLALILWPRPPGLDFVAWTRRFWFPDSLALNSWVPAFGSRFHGLAVWPWFFCGFGAPALTFRP